MTITPSNSDESTESARNRSRQPCRGIILRRRYRNVRLPWAQHNVINRYKKHIVFSDGSGFNLSISDGRCRVFRHPNERFSDKCVVGHAQLGGGSSMVWGAINYAFKTELIICQGN